MDKRIRKTVIVTVLVTLLVTAILLWTVFRVSDKIKENRDWREHLWGNMECEGRIVHIASRDSYGGTILYLDTGWNHSEELVLVWVYEDTILFGELNGKTMEQIIEERVADVYVSVEIFPFETGIIENTRLYPAMSVSLLHTGDG